MIDKTVEVAAIKPDEATADDGLEEEDGELDITMKGDKLNKPLPVLFFQKSWAITQTWAVAV